MLLSYALGTVTVFLLVIVLWQYLAGRWGDDPVDAQAAHRAAGAFLMGAVVTGVAAVVVRLMV